MKIIMEDVLNDVAAVLPDLMREALRNYEESQTTEAESEIKNIKLRQDTGRASLIHMLQIIKTAKIIRAMDVGNENLAQEIESAQREIAQIRQQRKSE